MVLYSPVIFFFFCLLDDSYTLGVKLGDERAYM